MVTRRQKWILVMFLASIWAFSVVAPAFLSKYKPPPEINTGLPAIIGALIAIPAKGDSDEDGDDT